MKSLSERIVEILGVACTSDFNNECIEKVNKVLDSSNEEVSNEALVNNIMVSLGINFPNKKSIKEDILELLK
jgi:hypothetical protein